MTYAGLTQNTFDALSSFAWNVGATAACGSRAVGLINQGRIVEGCNALSRTPDGKPNWSYAGGTFVQGLYNRRTEETKLCMK
ncbi:Lysozyme RrrD [compost metagenome]